MMTAVIDGDDEDDDDDNDRGIAGGVAGPDHIS